MSLRRRTHESGFTIVEILLAMSVASIMIIVMFSVTFNYYANAIQSQTAADMALESQTILSQMVEDLRLADGVGTSNQIPDPYASSWYTDDANNVLIIRYPTVNASRDIIYDTSTGNPYQNELIYFMSGNILYKRTLKNTNAVGNTANATCPLAYASAACPVDRKFSVDINNLAFTFYNSNNVVTTDPSLARSVKLTVSLSKKVFGKPLSLSNTTQITQRNQ